MASRATRLAPWGRDDTTIVIAWIFSLGFLGSNIHETTIGVGKPSWARSFWQIEQSLFDLFISTMFYVLELGFIKISICFLYMRIFPGKIFQRIMWATQVLIASATAAFFFMGFAQCQPFSAYWTDWDGMRSGRCFNINRYAYAFASVHIALDVLILVLPTIQVWKLNMTWKKKIEVTFMFSFGVLLTVISIFRLSTLEWIAKNHFNMRILYATTIWTASELATGMFVACVPAARIFILYYAGIALAATGLSRSGSSQLALHDKNSAFSSAPERHASNGRGNPPASEFKLPMPSLGGMRLSSSIVRELRRSTSEEQLIGHSLVELDSVTVVASKDEMDNKTKGWAS
ncbi:hypothetical protein N0V82_003117 [Gnomoniopsis sp. IMI 355080]|nr:hypothetical protein N0V82_003117 [Gnomoniopsis sp. IMI 355080]